MRLSVFDYLFLLSGVIFVADGWLAIRSVREAPPQALPSHAQQPAEADSLLSRRIWRGGHETAWSFLLSANHAIKCAMKSLLLTLVLALFSVTGTAVAGTRSAIITDTPLVLNIPANWVLNVHQYYFIYSSGGLASIGLSMKIGSETIGGLLAKQVNGDDPYGAVLWPERPFKVAGPAQVTVTAASNFKSFITYSVDPR